MKRVLTILLATALLFSLAACREGPPEEATAQTPPAPNRDHLPTLADAVANWAWASSNGSDEEAATHLVVHTYALEADFGKLDLAMTPYGQVKVEYLGEKQRGEGEDTYDVISGPHYAFEQPVAVHGQEPLLLVDSGALGNGLVPLEQQYDRETLAYPPACDADIARAEARQGGVRIAQSQLLATAQDGACICWFRYESLDHANLFSFAYIEEDGVFLSYDRLEPESSDYNPWWQPQPNDASLLMLFRTKEAIIISGSRRNPNDGILYQSSLQEVDGALEQYGLACYVYSIPDNEFFLYDD